MRSSGGLRLPRAAYPLGLSVCLLLYVAYIKWHWASGAQALLSITEVASGGRGGQRTRIPPAMAPLSHQAFYGIMFDAGSTGTRVHIFHFSQRPGETPTLKRETFKALEPGLSAYADDIEKSTLGIQELLDVAKQDIPFNFWKATPLVLKATAGLRLLPGEKAQKLLQKVKEVFKASPFLVRDDCVSIMNGTDEGVSAWITVNFLTGRLENPGSRNVGMLDLGGGSTQISFLPRSEDTLQAAPPGHLTALQMFNRTYRLYAHSYLGLGLMSARLAILGGVEGQPGGSHIPYLQAELLPEPGPVCQEGDLFSAPDGKELVSPCLPPSFRGEWEHAEIAYRIAGQDTAGSLHELCANRVSSVLHNQVHRTEEVKEVEFYAFSYYYDLAADVGLIDMKKGGSLLVGDFELAAQYVCRTAEVRPLSSPFACMDLTYISLLLQELGFPRSKVLQLTRKIHNIETSWALGATFHYIESLGRQKSLAS